MNPQKFLAFDYGKKYIGVAVGSTVSGSAQGITTINNHDHTPDWQGIARVVEQWQPNAFVVGLPLNMDGSDTKITKKVKRFGETLADRYNLPVHMVDERLSTIAAKNALAEAGISLKRRNKSKIDMMAAETILQGFLDEYNGS